MPIKGSNQLGLPCIVTNESIFKKTKRQSENKLPRAPLSVLNHPEMECGTTRGLPRFERTFKGIS